MLRPSATSRQLLQGRREDGRDVPGGGRRALALPGDHATVAADGTIVLRGRESLSINTGGEKVFSEEVEEVLLAYPAIRDAVVVGAPDERWGQRVVAVVEACSDACPHLEDVQQHCRRTLAGYKVPPRARGRRSCAARRASGKADYAWARSPSTRLVTEAVAASVTAAFLLALGVVAATGLVVTLVPARRRPCSRSVTSRSAGSPASSTIGVFALQVVVATILVAGGGAGSPPGGIGLGLLLVVGRLRRRARRKRAVGPAIESALVET